MLLKTSVYSQRDSKWASILLGYNKSKHTIGTDGCLITAFGCYINKTPIEINDILKSSQGFTENSGLFIWSKSTVLGLKEVYSSPHYTGPVTTQGINKIKECLDAGYPLLCEIDFNKNTTHIEMHWVLIVGYENDDIFCVDPWVGMIVNLEVYGGAKCAIIQFKQYDKQLQLDGQITLQKELDTCINDRNTHWNTIIWVCDKLGIAHDVNRLKEEIEHLISVEELYRKKIFENDNLKLEIENLKSQVLTIQESIKEKDTKLTELQDKITGMQTELDNKKTEHNDTKKQLSDVLGQLEVLKGKFDEVSWLVKIIDKVKKFIKLKLGGI